MEIFNGDSLIFNYSCNLEDDSLYEFKKDDILKIIIYKLSHNEECIKEEIKFDIPKTNIDIHIDKSKMKNLKPGYHMLEIKLLTDDKLFTTLQEQVTIKESWLEDE